MKNSIAFLTIIPVGMDTDGLAQAAWCMPLFPLIGAIIGLAAGLCVWVLELILPESIAAVIGVGLLLLINGVQHTDGLLDFGDGLMYHGSRREKLRVMRDPTTGAGGLALGLVILLATIFAIAATPSPVVILALVASESSAMFAMVLSAAVGRAAHKGMSTIFVESMHHQRGLRVAVAYVIVLGILLLVLRFVGIALVVGATVIGFLMVLISRRSFGGLTGDVLGATYDVTRVFSLLLVLVLLKWV